MPKEVLYDNLRTVVQQRNAYGRGLHRFHPGLKDLAQHYTFMPRLCRPYRAKTKGKVERGIGYIRRSFFVPLTSRYRQLKTPLDLETLNAELSGWLTHKANARVHGTTGDVPAQRLIKERVALQPLPPRTLGGVAASEPTDRSFQHAFAVETLQHPLSVYDTLLETL